MNYPSTITFQHVNGLLNSITKLIYFSFILHRAIVLIMSNYVINDAQIR